MAKNRIIELPQTKGTFQLKGKVTGTEKENFFIEKKIDKTGSNFRAINFGVTYEDKATVYVGLNGSEREKVYFSKRGAKGEKSTTKEVNWGDRNRFSEEGFNIIGITCGLQQERNEKGGVDNVTKTLVEYDACEYMNAYLEDDMDVFMSGNIEFSSFTNKANETICRINYKPSRIYACKAPIDFDAEGYEPQHDFKQRIVFRDIEQEKEDDKPTGRFIVSAWIVNYASIENANFIITDKGLANLFKKNLKEYMAIDVSGEIVCRTIVEQVSTEGCWGVPSKMDRVNHPVVREMIITGAVPSSIDKETYTEKEMNKAFEAIRKAKNAEDNFEAKNDDTDDWGKSKDFNEDEELPW